MLPLVLAAQTAEERWPEGMDLDFGEIADKTERYDSLLLVNAHDFPLVIENIRPSCGCTAVDWPVTPIEPGDSTYIQIAFRCTRSDYVYRHLDVWFAGFEERDRIYVEALCPER